MRTRHLVLALGLSALVGCSSGTRVKGRADAATTDRSVGTRSDAADRQPDGRTAARDTRAPDAANYGCTEDPSLTESERRLIELPADSWYEAPNTKLEDVCTAVST
jgi:hypothetical protein